MLPLSIPLIAQAGDLAGELGQVLVGAALAVAEERGLTLEETLRLSTAAGAASVMCTGTQAASLETIQQLMEQVTYREL